MKTEIVYEDSDILVVYKPAGIATQAAGLLQTDVVSELKNYLMANHKGEKPKEPYLGLIHRLDQPVEGILVFAKTPQAAALLSRQAAERALTKEYLAVVLAEEEKVKQAEKITLTDFLIKDGRNNLSRVGKACDQNAKKAVLSYEVVKTNEISGPGRSNRPNGSGSAVTALLRIHLQTGRHHQIRVQLANAGMPLLGDFKYGSADSQNLSRELGVKDVALCAHRLSFKHPKTGKTEEFTVLPKRPVLRDSAG